MKVLLVKPYNLSDPIQPSLRLGYLATAIRREHEVVILNPSMAPFTRNFPLPPSW
ncbi:MAG: hypothetical protein NTY16_09150 [Deltaproteobacteria bacterium]|nr:hypothetical protein [Deltaproteobacteria bacterium]